MDQEPDTSTVRSGNNDLSVTGTGPVGVLPHVDVSEHFNGPLMPRDPTHLLGARLDAFALNFVQQLGPDGTPKAELLRAETYHLLHQHLAQAPGARMKSLNVDYSDDKVPGEGPRRYIRVQMQTLRDTQVTTLFRCYVAGSYLYMAADSYRLGRMRVSALIFRMLLTFGVLLWSLTTALYTFGTSLVLFALFFWWAWGTVVRGIVSGRVEDALRVTFPRAPRESSFDVDDILIYLKALLPTVGETFRESCVRHGLDTTTTDEILQELRRKLSSAEPSMIVNNFGSIAGSILGGSRNTVRGK